MPVSKLTLLPVLVIIAMEIITLVLNILYRQQLFQMSMGYIIDYQAQQSSGFVIGIYNFFSIICSTYVMVGIIALLHFVLKSKLVTLIIIFYVVLNAFVMALQKQCYQETRPILVDPSVRLDDWICQPSYGFPSGHTWVSFLVYGMIIDDLIGTAGWKKLFLLWLPLVGTLNPVSRMYLGSHSGDQVVYAIFNSVAMIVLYHFVVQKKIYELFKSGLKGHRFGLILTITTILFLIAIAAPIIVYEVNASNRRYPQIYIDRLNQRCNKNISYDESEKSQGVAVAIVGLAFGIIYGFLISGRMNSCFEVTNQMGVRKNLLVQFLVGNWKYGGCMNIAKYVLIYVAFTVGFLLVFVVLIPLATDNFYGKLILNIFGFLGMGVSLPSFIPLLIFRCNAIEFNQSEGVVAIGTEQVMNKPSRDGNHNF